MKKTQRLGFLTAVFFVLVCISNTVFASETKGYFGLGWVDAGFRDSTYTTSTNTWVNTSSAQGLHLIGGYRLHENFAVEADYTNFDVRATSQITGTVTSYGLSGVGIIPTGNMFSLLGKIGVASVSTTTTISSALSTPPAGVNTSASVVGLTYGLGFQFNWSHGALRFALDSYPYYELGGRATNRTTGPSLTGLFAF